MKVTTFISILPLVIQLVKADQIYLDVINEVKNAPSKIYTFFPAIFPMNWREAAKLCERLPEAYLAEVTNGLDKRVLRKVLEKAELKFPFWVKLPHEKPQNENSQETDDEMDKELWNYFDVSQIFSELENGKEEKVIGAKGGNEEQSYPEMADEKEIEKSEAGKPKTETGKPETGTGTPETRDGKLETGASKSKTGTSKQETGAGKHETGTGNLDTEQSRTGKSDAESRSGAINLTHNPKAEGTPAKDEEKCHLLSSKDGLTEANCHTPKVSGAICVQYLENERPYSDVCPQTADRPWVIIQRAHNEMTVSSLTTCIGNLQLTEVKCDPLSGWEKDPCAIRSEKNHQTKKSATNIDPKKYMNKIPMENAMDTKDSFNEQADNTNDYDGYADDKGLSSNKKRKTSSDKDLLSPTMEKKLRKIWRGFGFENEYEKPEVFDEYELELVENEKTEEDQDQIDENKLQPSTVDISQVTIDDFNQPNEESNDKNTMSMIRNLNFDQFSKTTSSVNANEASIEKNDDESATISSSFEQKESLSSTENVTKFQTVLPVTPRNDQINNQQDIDTNQISEAIPSTNVPILTTVQIKAQDSTKNLKLESHQHQTDKTGESSSKNTKSNKSPEAIFDILRPLLPNLDELKKLTIKSPNHRNDDDNKLEVFRRKRHIDVNRGNKESERVKYSYPDYNDKFLDNLGYMYADYEYDNAHEELKRRKRQTSQDNVELIEKLMRNFIPALSTTYAPNVNNVNVVSQKTQNPRSRTSAPVTSGTTMKPDTPNRQRTSIKVDDEKLNEATGNEIQGEKKGIVFHNNLASTTDKPNLEANIKHLAEEISKFMNEANNEKKNFGIGNDLANEQDSKTAEESVKNEVKIPFENSANEELDRNLMEVINTYINTNEENNNMRQDNEKGGNKEPITGSKLNGNKNDETTQNNGLLSNIEKYLGIKESTNNNNEMMNGETMKTKNEENEIVKQENQNNKPETQMIDEKNLIDAIEKYLNIKKSPESNEDTPSSERETAKDLLENIEKYIKEEVLSTSDKVHQNEQSRNTENQNPGPTSEVEAKLDDKPLLDSIEKYIKEKVLDSSTTKSTSGEKHSESDGGMKDESDASSSIDDKVPQGSKDSNTIDEKTLLENIEKFIKERILESNNEQSQVDGTDENKITEDTANEAKTAASDMMTNASDMKDDESKMKKGESDTMNNASNRKNDEPSMKDDEPKMKNDESNMKDDESQANTKEDDKMILSIIDKYINMNSNDEKPKSGDAKPKDTEMEKDINKPEGKKQGVDNNEKTTSETNKKQKTTEEKEMHNKQEQTEVNEKRPIIFPGEETTTNKVTTSNLSSTTTNMPSVTRPTKKTSKLARYIFRRIST